MPAPAPLSNPAARDGERAGARSERPERPEGNADLVRQVLAFALAHARLQGPVDAEQIPDVPVRVTKADARSVPPLELRERLDEILLSKKADIGLVLLERSGFLQAVLPEICELVGFGEGHNKHKDVWRHTLQVVIQSLPRPAVRWAALFHDVGKPRTRSIAPDGTVHFLHHAEVGARMFHKVAARERLFEGDCELKERIQFLVLHHQRAHQYEESWTDSATRRFAREIGDALPDLMALSRADMTTKRKEKRRRFMVQLKELQTRIDALLLEDNKPKALPKGLGEALIETFRLPPSKLVGDIRKKLELAVENGELPLQADFDVYLDFVRQNPERFCLPEQGEL
jgi:poly(A) polymerase